MYFVSLAGARQHAELVEGEERGWGDWVLPKQHPQTGRLIRIGEYLSKLFLVYI